MRSVWEIEGENRGRLRGLRRAALVMLREKFGDLPAEADARVHPIQSDAELTALLKAILRANSLAELGLADEPDDNGP